MVDHNDISEKNGDGEEIYYAERLEGDASLAGPETICLVKEDGKSADLFRIPAGCNEEHSVGECIGAGEQLAEMLELDLRIPGVAVVTTAYIRNGMDSVVGSFCRGTDDEKWLACRFLKALQRLLSERENCECWPEISEKAKDEFKKWVLCQPRNLLGKTIFDFADLIFGPALSRKFFG